MVSLRLSITISRSPSLDSSHEQFDTYPDPQLGPRSLSYENTYTEPPTYTTSTLPAYISFPTRDESEQHLIPKRKRAQVGKRQVVYCTKEQLLAQSAERKRRFEEQQARERTERLGREGNMVATGNATVIEERRRSFGIGGAGNIRRPSDVIYPVRRESIAENDTGDMATKKKRRSSAWSLGTSGDATGSSPGKKGIWGFWRRGSDAS